MAKTRRNIVRIVLVVLLVVLLGAMYWACKPLKATEIAYSYMDTPSQTVFLPEGVSATDEIECALVFYPGAKVEPAAYAPLLSKIAKNGWMCVLVDAPLHLSILNKNAADQVLQNYPNVKHWYVGGHSMGGYVASEFAKDHVDKVEGVAYVAAYGTSAVEANPFDAVFVYGTNDTVLSLEKTLKSIDEYGNQARVCVIEGGNHAQFGSYGDQQGDSPATVSAEDQVQQAADFITRKAA